MSPIRKKRLIYLLYRTSQIANQIFTEATEHALLTPTQYIVLSALDGQGSASQTELVRRTGIDRSTLGGVILRLIEENYVIRQQSTHDRRAYSIELSPMGVEALRVSESAAKSAEEQQLSVLPTEARHELLATLATLINNSPRVRN